MRGWWLIVVAACYAPHAAPGAPCGVGDVCPSGLTCVDNVCALPGTQSSDAARRDADPLDAVRAPDARVFLDAPPDAAPPSGLVAYWKFDDDPSDGALDSTGRGHTGTCDAACPTLVTGHTGSAYQFDATNSETLVVPDSGDFRGNVTIAAWFMANDATAALSMLAKPLGTGTDDTWQLEVRDTGAVSFSGGTVHYVDDGTAITRGVWHHAAGTWDGTTKRLYLDGVEVANAAATLSYDTHAVYLGADNNTGTTVLYFSGALDELRVYSRALSAAEIAMIAQ
jgi:hypothetical protein